VKSPPTRSNFIVLFIAFAIIATLVNFPHLHNPFLHDDTHSIRDNTALRSISNIPKFFKDPFLFDTEQDINIYRPILLVTYAINYAVSGLDPWSWRLFNLLLMAVNAALFVLLLRGWGVRGRAGVFAGLLFLLHPVSGYCFRLVSARSALLLALFLLLGTAAHLRAVREPGSRLTWIALSLFCMALGLMSSSAVVVFPALVLLVEGEKLRAEPKSVAARVAPSAAFAVIYIAARAYFIGQPFGEHYVRPVTINLALQAEAWWLYIKWTFFPLYMPIYVPLKDPRSFLDIGVLLSVLGLAGWAAIGLKWWLDRERRLLGLLLLWLPVCYLPYAIVPLNVPVAYHHYYLSLAGAAGLAALWLFNNGRRFIAPVCVALVCFAALNHTAARPWRDYMRWAGEAVRETPSSGRAWNEVGLAHGKKGRYERAVDAYRMALDKNNKLKDVYYNIGVAYFFTKKYRLAIEHLEFYQTHPAWEDRDPEADGVIGMALVKVGMPHSAMFYLEEGLKAVPNSTEFQAHKYEALDKIRRVNAALKNHGRLFGDSLDDFDVFKSRVELVVNMRDFEVALDFIDRAEERHSDRIEYYFIKAHTMARAGEREVALKVIDEAGEKFSDMTPEKREKMNQLIRKIKSGISTQD